MATNAGGDLEHKNSVHSWQGVHAGIQLVSQSRNLYVVYQMTADHNANPNQRTTCIGLLSILFPHSLNCLEQIDDLQQ